MLSRNIVGEISMRPRKINVLFQVLTRFRFYQSPAAIVSKYLLGGTWCFYSVW